MIDSPWGNAVPGQLLLTLRFCEEVWNVRVPRGPRRNHRERSSRLGLKNLDRALSALSVKSISRVHSPFPQWQLKHKKWAGTSRSLDSTFLVQLEEKSWHLGRALAILSERKGVESVGPNTFYRPSQAAPRDWASQIGFLAPVGSGSGNPKVLVAVIDTGIQTAHPELAPYVKRVEGCDVVDVAGIRSPHGEWVTGDYDTPDSDPADDLGHGTHVAGIIGGQQTGVATGVTLMPIRALATSENRIGERTALGKSDDIARAIRLAADQGAHVINMSFANAEADTASGRYSEKKAIEYAAHRGCFLVAAMGNDKAVGSAFPASAREVCGVAALEPDDSRWPQSQAGVHCDLSAPGVDIVSAQLGGGLRPSTGTSMAAALVSGVAARLLSAAVDRGRPLPNGQHLGQLLTGTARKVWSTPAQRTNEFGYGCVNLESALGALNDDD